MCAVVGEGVGLGGLSVLGPDPGGDVSGVAGGGAGLDRGVVPERHQCCNASIGCRALGEQGRQALIERIDKEPPRKQNAVTGGSWWDSNADYPGLKQTMSAQYGTLEKDVKETLKKEV